MTGLVINMTGFVLYRTGFSNFTQEVCHWLLCLVWGVFGWSVVCLVGLNTGGFGIYKWFNLSLGIGKQTKLLKCWNVEMLKLWNSEMLQFWNSEIFKYWNTEILKC